MRKMQGRGMRTNREDQKGEISLTSAIKCVEFVKKWYPYIFENSQGDGLLICFWEQASLLTKSQYSNFDANP